jgi:hypothetical protein
MSARGLMIGAALVLSAQPGAAAELKPQTIAAFDRYVSHTEARIASEVASADRFIFVDAMAEPRRRQAEQALRSGELVIERLTTRDRDRAIEAPDGMIHHWIGLVFARGVTLEQAVGLLQDYDRHQDVYRPAVAASRLVSRTGDTFLVFLRFYQKKGITVVVNSDHEARFTRSGSDRAHSRIVSTRIAEVDDPGTPREREKPVGQDNGFLWRLNTYWRFLERDGGTYVQCESISLTRRIPFALAWLIGPFVNSIPRESLEFTLNTTRRVLAPAP